MRSTLFRVPACVISLSLIFASMAGQSEAPGGGPSVTMAPVPLADLIRGSQGKVDLRFRISPKFHINSNRPSSQYLIPTTLKLDAPTDIAIGKIRYPAGTDVTFPFAPDEKLNVYSGEFEIAVAVHPLRSVVPGAYKIRGQLRYQACDDRACYPPKNVPVEFDVRVRKATSVRSVHRTPQSPHIHN